MSKRQIRFFPDHAVNQLSELKGINCQCLTKTGETLVGTMGIIEANAFQLQQQGSRFIYIPFEDLSEIWLDVPFAY